MRIIHTADFHIGLGLPEFSESTTLNEERFNDIIKNFEFIKNYAIDNKADFLIIAGDIFHHPRPSIKAFISFSKILGEIIKNDIQTVIVLGNHDTPKTYEMLSYLKSFENVNLKNFHLFDKADFKILETKNGEKVKFIGLPYPHFQSTLEYRDFIFAFEKKFDSLINVNKSQDYTIVIGHLLVEGGKLGSEKRVESLQDYEIPENILNKKEVNIVCLGHLHTPQQIGDKIFYSGSIERIDFGEENEEKSFLDINIKEKVEVKRVKLNLRPMKTIVMDISQYLDPVNKMIEILERENIQEGSIIRIIAKLFPKHKINVAKVEEYLKKNKKVLTFKIKFERIEEKEKIISTKATTIKEKLISYIENKYKGKGEDFVKKLKEETFKIIEEVEEE